MSILLQVNEIPDTSYKKYVNESWMFSKEPDGGWKKLTQTK